MSIIQDALDREAQRPEPVRTDYAAAKKMLTRQKSQLTRAVNTGDPEKVAEACRDAIREWNQPGMFWPDDWARWQRALDDALPWHQQVDISSL